VHPAIQRALNEIAELQERKGADYALDTDPWSNFRGTADHFDLRHYEAAIFNVIQKLQRLKSLRSNGRDPQNEAVRDTYKDLAVYGVLAFAMFLDEEEQNELANSSNTSSSEPGQANTVAQCSSIVLCCETHRRTLHCLRDHGTLVKMSHLAYDDFHGEMIWKSDANFATQVTR